MYRLFLLQFVLLFCASATSNGAVNATKNPVYGLGLRGNGELQPAHFGALARVIEDQGIPTLASGGSSAAVSLFYLDAILSQPELWDNLRGAVRLKPQAHVQVAFLLKSLEGFMRVLSQTELFQTLATHYQFISSARKDGLLAELDQVVKALHEPTDILPKIQVAVQTLNGLGLFPSTAVEVFIEVLSQPTKAKIGHAKFVAQELSDSIRVFGKFDVKGDHNLFFRPGIIDFNRLAGSFARIGAFYSGLGAEADLQKRFAKWLNTCSKNSVGHTWNEIVASQPGCEIELKSLIQEYFRNGNGAMSSLAREEEARELLMRPVGFSLNILISTSVITGTSVAQVEEAFENYRNYHRSDFGRTFRLRDPSNLKFGYMGRKRTLQKIAIEYENSKFLDAKQQRFLSLPDLNWATALSLSPAEPGLSPMVEFKDANGEKLYSAGGWSNLHPTQIIRAAGAKRVVLITREGGETPFGQGVAKRLLNLEKPWEEILPDKSGQTPVTSYYSVKDQSSPWSKLYNMADRDSGFLRATMGADLILLTKWNDFKIQDGMAGMVEQAYRSPYIEPVKLERPMDALFINGCSEILGK